MNEDYEEVNVKVTQTFTRIATVEDENGHYESENEFDSTIGRRSSTEVYVNGDLEEAFHKDHLDIINLLEAFDDIVKELIEKGYKQIANHTLNYLRDEISEWEHQGTEVYEI